MFAVPRQAAAVFSIAAALVLQSAPAGAQTDEKALAETLFQAGQDLMREGSVAEACAKFQASMDLDRSGGTAINLGQCLETLGKLASAWAVYNEALVLARRDGHDARRDFARERLDALTPRLAKLRIVVDGQHAPPGLTVKLDGVPLAPAALGIDTPQDVGTHEVRAEAPGYQPWVQSVKVDRDGEVSKVTIPALHPNATAPAAAAAPQPPKEKPTSPPPSDATPPADAAPEAGTSLGAGFWISAGATVALGAGAIVTGVIYASDSQAYDRDNVTGCMDCADKKASLETLGAINLAFLGGTIAAAGLTTYFLLSGGSDAEAHTAIAPWFDQNGGGIGIRGRL